VTRLALIVGNGATIDFCQSAGIALDPSNPFEWAFRVPGENGISWQDAFPRLSAVLRTGTIVRSFDAFAMVLARLRADRRVGREVELDAEARQFLVFAYSVLQERANAAGMREWTWASWITEHRSEMKAVTSFNYDLLLENALLVAGVRPRRPGVLGEEAGLFFLKPHGSIDFASDPRAIVMPTSTYPLRNFATLNDTGLVALPTPALRGPRQEGFVVLPAEYSPYLNFQWVAPGYRAWQEGAHTLTHCIFLGLSDWECDRSEIDFLLDSLAPTTAVVIANPDPPASFLARVKASGRPSIEWRHGPDTLDRAAI
jgi:hypothetical protein